MKTVFESYIFFLSFIVFLIFGISFVGVLNQMDRARMLHYYALSQIENFNGLSNHVVNLIDESDLCSTCDVIYSIEEDSRVYVEIEYPIEMGIIDLKLKGWYGAYTIPLG